MKGNENKREAYLNQHIYGNANRLAEHLRDTGALDALGYWCYPGEEEEGGYGREIMSWWIVSYDMARRLQEAGYCVLNYEEEVYLWGRTSHGIAMHLEESFVQDLGIG
ncbi:hypothetical protein [Burkholderia vietnamiensis]|uniref:hypothetical protein n=1 Tax=Burkholderia vietnamiensis TaxID=60552 RepID=UPI001B9F0A9D|nr:hypothetical protein [Burkholderia vietnamiensis]MBR7998433.1 hypothetical protein [Burkholderia vietnamiensis]